MLSLAANHLVNDGFVFSVRLDDLVMEAVKSELKAVADAELVVNFAEIVLDNLLGGAELVGDLLVALALGDAGDDGHLLGRETGLAARVYKRGSLGAIGLNDPVYGLVIDPGFAFGDTANAADEQVWRDGTGNDAPDAAAIELHGMVFVGNRRLNNQLDIGGHGQEIVDSVWRAGEQRSFQQNHIRGVALDGVLQTFQGVSLRDYAEIVFESKYLANSDAKNGFRIREGVGVWAT